MSLVITSITPSGVTLANATGQTVDGKPFVSVPVPVAGLAPGQKIANILLKFSDPTRVRFTFTTSVLAVDPPVSLVVAQSSSSARLGPSGFNRWLNCSGGFLAKAGQDRGDAWTKPWVHRFLLDLADDRSNPNAHLRVVIPSQVEPEPVVATRAHARGLPDDSLQTLHRETAGDPATKVGWDYEPRLGAFNTNAHHRSKASAK